MSRSGYDEDECENIELYRGAVNKALKGKRGQAFLKELLSVLDSLPQKRLIANYFNTENGEVCALGAIGLKRGVDMKHLDNEELYKVGKAFGIAWSMAAEIMYENDEGAWKRETPEEKFVRMRDWVSKQIIEVEK